MKVNSVIEFIDNIKSFSIEEKIDLFSEDTYRDLTTIEEININGYIINQYINEFWTSKQRQASSLHEISYRACFKPQLPRFFIERLTKKNDIVYDPFSGRGTTVIEAGLLGRRIISNDVSPISKIFVMPRFFIPEYDEVEKRLKKVISCKSDSSILDLSMFFHKTTLQEILSLKLYLNECFQNDNEDHIDRWIRMIATNRLTGHSPGFFSVYTLPPNQAVSPSRQEKINQKRNQIPPYRDVTQIILKKHRSLTSKINHTKIRSLIEIGKSAQFIIKDAGDTKEILSNSVNLTVTSPPFLNIVQYSKDNWLRCWFNSIDACDIENKITMSSTVDKWSKVMLNVFEELFRITKEGGYVAFEVGEVKNKSINLDEVIVPLGIKVGFKCIGILINLQEFTKTSNIWGISNNNRGTNTNRIVIFRKINNNIL